MQWPVVTQENDTKIILCEVALENFSYSWTVILNKGLIPYSEESMTC